MTDNEIIKALECCKKRTVFEECPVECPMYKFDGDCFDLMQIDILDLINRQKAEIERLNNNISAMAITLSNSAKGTRAEAIKEFAERLKEEINKSLDEYWNGNGGGYYLAEDVHFDIDFLVKEMVGDTE